MVEWAEASEGNLAGLDSAGGGRPPVLTIPRSHHGRWGSSRGVPGARYHGFVPEFSDDAVVLDAIPYRDRDQILSVLTREHGLVRGVHRGARSGKAPAAAATQVLSLVRVTAWRKPSAELATFRSVEAVRPSFSLARDMDRSAAAAAVAELLLGFCPADDPLPRHHRLAAAVAEELLGSGDPAALLAYVQVWVLQLGGVLPPLDACSACGSPLGGAFHAHPADGLPLCPRCAPPGSERVDAAAAAFLRRALRVPPGSLAGGVPPGALRWLDRRVREEAHRPLKALEFFRRYAGQP